MPSYVKAYILLVMIMAALYPVYQSLYGNISKKNESFMKVNELVFIWFLVTTSIFFGMHFLVVFFVLFILSLKFNKNLDQSIQVFIFLYLISPLYELNLSFIPGVNSILKLTYLLSISLFFLFPIILKLKSQKDYIKFGRTTVDKFFIVLSVLYLYNFYRGFATVPGLAREILVYYFEFFLPYLVLSRYLVRPAKMEFLLFPILIAGLYLAFICIFEFLFSWRLYGLTDKLLQSDDVFTTFKFRGGYLRATSVFAQAIITGYFMVVVLATVLYFNSVRRLNPIVFIFSTLLVISALYTTSSRGPWVGSMVLLFSYYVVFSDKKMKGLMVSLAVLLLTFLLLIVSGQFERFVSLLPFFGSSDVGDYRSRLFDAAMIVYKDNILFGAHRFDFVQHPAMQAMIQGEGIIDIVNTFLNVLLTYGVVGLFSYLLVFYYGLTAAYKLRGRSYSSDNRSLYSIFLSLFIMHLFVVATVSSIGHLLSFTTMLMGVACAFQITQRIDYDQK